MFDAYLPFAVVMLFGVITFWELIYYYLIFARFSFKKKKNPVAIQPVPISIVMVVKNAAGTLLKTLPRLLNQQYETFELVIVDDKSQDDTKMLVLEYQQQYPNIKLIDMATSVTTIRGKKFAISMGIRCASYEHILLFMDSECLPSSTHWLEKMARNFVGQTKIVLGYSTYEKRNNPINRFLHFDNLVNAMHYFSLACVQSTYRGDDRNMAFNSALFYNQRGFASHNHISYGHEDIFISRAATQNNTAIEYSPESFTVFQKRVDYRLWKEHKEGLYFTRKHNTRKNRFILSSYEILNLLFYLLLALSIVITSGDIVLFSIVMSILGVRIISLYFVFGFAASKLCEKQVIPALLFYDFVFALLNPLHFIAAKIHHDRFL